ncbi:hypothetical protein RFI_12609 [Reticulomyxa filosa]|uniref:C3H1-type domain-containing protein n=1 Tax=Reticulomyxa filosa TaxID=46433 RepID=X6NGQ8_RETFI|nr:hypothetical protein RFI_12609 [Reticulomyxa filosa]|eukprot:ETO24547.1 hypothetical protein RFI_12609 [Reticulomyxa filosa]
MHWLANGYCTKNAERKCRLLHPPQHQASNRICMSFYWKGKCTRSSGTCRFQHDYKIIPCAKYAEEDCTNANCPHSHNTNREHYYAWKQRFEQQQIAYHQLRDKYSEKKLFLQKISQHAENESQRLNATDTINPFSHSVFDTETEMSGNDHSSIGPSNSQPDASTTFCL